MDWLLKFLIIWLSFDVVIIATGWYTVNTIKPYFPNWWSWVVVDDAPLV